MKIEITTEFITLAQFLKLADLIESGGEAKMFLVSNTIEVNDVLDNRRGRKLYSGDVIKVNGKPYEIC